MHCRIQLEFDTREKELELVGSRLQGLNRDFEINRARSSENARELECTKRLCAAVESEAVESALREEMGERPRTTAPTAIRESHESVSVQRTRSIGRQPQSTPRARIEVVHDPRKSEAKRRAESELLGTISQHSAELAEMLTRRCDVEMERTRIVDELFEKEEIVLNKKLKELKEMDELDRQVAQLQGEYNKQAQDDFNVLVDLAITMESLEKEIAKESENMTKRGSSKQSLKVRSVLKPIRDSTCALQDRVDALQAELSEKEVFYAAEAKRLAAQLSRSKTGQRNATLKFQEDMKSVFTDFKFLFERVDRAEASLEKLNLHYQLDEEEMLGVIAPIIDEIDSVKDIIANLERDAHSVLYDESLVAN